MTLHHVALETRRADVDAEVAFWGLLGFAPVPVPEGLRDATTWVARGTTQVHLLWTDEPTVPAGGHAAVVCEDWATVTGALAAAGFTVKPRREHWGAARAFTWSPGGHRVELMAAPPAAT